MRGVLRTQLRRISTPGGDVFHAMKSIDPGYAGFGEAYFSAVEHRWIKGWKRHNKATLNFVVPHGEVQVSICDAEADAYETHRLGPSNADSYARLSIAPGLWVAFGGLAVGSNLLLNISSLPHDPLEADNRPLSDLKWTWLQD
jgi:dTDP-4-dehydrorhamnose 3,5-epimerase